jgi:succinate-acetate transporter protein
MEAASIHQHPAQGASPPVTGAGEQPIARSWSPANPAPLGLAAFAMTTFVLSMFNANLVSEKGTPVVLGLALAYGGIVQVLAGMWEFRTGNTFGAVAFSSFGAFWISFWALEVFYAKSIGGNVGHSVGLYLWAWAIFTAYMTVAALRVSGAVLLVFMLLTATFILLAIGAAGSHTTVTHWGGYVGLATAAAAWYASFAAVVNSTFGRTLLPVIPLAVGTHPRG